jgi:3-deoxy-D-manno-octulosonic-acid transferase
VADCKINKVRRVKIWPYFFWQLDMNMNSLLVAGRRGLYTCVLYLIGSLVPLYLLYRAWRQPAYARGWAQRFGWAYVGKSRQNQELAARRIWLHAVSVGETRAAQGLVEAVYAAHTDCHIILTHTTPTGRAAGEVLFASYLNSGKMEQVYVPYDLPFALKRFLNYFRPTDCWVMETEVWPNWLALCARRKIPVALVNGRLSEKTLSQTLKYGLVARLFGDAYRRFTHVLAQTELDAQRYLQVGVAADRLQVLGNLKFGAVAPPELLDLGARWAGWVKRHDAQRKIVLLASSREGEEQLWLDALAPFADLNVQWWVVPRHPQRFAQVAQLIGAACAGALTVRKSQLDALPDDAQRIRALQAARVVIGDSMGEMFAYYAAADVVLMGGAWLALGGQNFLEPLALGKPVLIGAHTFNFAQMTQDAVRDGVLMQVDDIRTAMQSVADVVGQAQPDLAQRARAIAFVQSRQGAVAKTLAALW